MQSIVDEGKVHFYEFLEVEIIQQYIRKGISYSIGAILNSSDKFVSLRYYAQEITMLLDFIKDWYMLQKNSGTFSQNFYSLERKNLNKPKQPLIHAFMWSFVPYALQKIDFLYNNLKREQQQGKRHSTFIKVFLKIYPYIYAIISIIQIVFKFRYLYFKDADYYNLLYWMFKVKTAYIQEEESSQPSKQRPIYQLLKSPLILCLLLGHKILSWYFTNSQRKKNQQGRRNLVLNPPMSENDRLQKEKKVDKGICPICGQKIINPAFLRTSGYTFCYSCITTYIGQFNVCPMTKIPSSADCIQIIYQ